VLKENRTVRPKKQVDNVNEDNKEIQEERNKVCHLCNRELPIFFYGNEEQIKRLPERALTTLLQDMKQDLENKLNYLKTLRVSFKFIQPCSCVDKDVHTYCMTASIIHKKRIYCDKCGNYYKLFVKQEKLCSGQLLTLICNYVAVLIFTFGCIIGILILDSYLKTVYAKKNPDETEKIYKENEKSLGVGILGRLSMNPDYLKSFDIKKSVRWTDLIPLFLVLLVLILWCFFFHLNRVIMTRKKLIYVEVRAFDDPISRQDSKQNLNLVIESNLKRKNNNKLFDKFWY